MTPEYILRKSLCRPAHCSTDTIENRAYHIDNIQYAKTYSEPGYSNPAKGILLGNWNHFSNDATRLLEKLGYEIEWEDEWATCEDCGGAVRISPDSYGWQSSYALIDECSIVCHLCLAKGKLEEQCD